MNSATDFATDLVLPLLIIVMLCQSLGYPFGTFVPAALACAYMVVQKTVLFLYGNAVGKAIERAGLGSQMLLARANLNVLLATSTVGAFLVVTGT
jgi:hypothetical protein